MSCTLVKGVVDFIDEFPKEGMQVGDCWMMGGDLFVWTDQGRWCLYGEETKQGLELTYLGISVILPECTRELSEVFQDTKNVSEGDLATLFTIYPKKYEEFEDLWAKGWTHQQAKQEFNKWRS